LAKLTMFFGVLLLALGGSAYLLTDSMHRSQLAPAVLGLVLLLCGVLANTENSRRRMLWMHIAVTVGLLGFLGTIMGLIDGVKLALGTVFPHPVAVEEKAATSVICLVFVGLCVRSFIAARRARTVAEA
jgi:hypothetical protein